VKIDWTTKLQHLLQTVAYCLAVATVLYGLQPDKPYAPNVVFSLCIGLIMWLVIDLGRHLLPSAAETGWPHGLQGVALVAVAIGGGFLLGTGIAGRFAVVAGWIEPGADTWHDWRSSLVVSLVAGIVASFYFYAQGRSTYLERKMGEVRQLADEARLKLLEAQLEPHMLFNTLANLRALIATDPSRAQAMLDHIIGYLRATLDASRSTMHPLQAEFDRLQDYLELMAIRMGARLRYELVLPRELAPLRVPTLLLQPLVENSIRHGLEPKVDGGHVTVGARREGQSLVLEVADTGLGASAGAASSSGFGLAQVRERLATVYGSAAHLQFTVVPGTGATAAIHLPVQA
jgi:signal transduction histidine kinase